ncbi:hypothetical protein PZ895_08085 [Mesorhizobium sp. YIM 152430]|uniref:hyaluronate lyase N-terminal domain-containing protein n=1 Tax=Mesorhizobium sp. YIM 152430 TaxID=3031761 RepID=UPI0023D9E95D|nr:hypothetical protein [Mesorhizobium sp. YIM 152430]MDF1599735.1 hypothetical protein [Mesorhizobium sp. YIM 152430]
MSQQIRRRRGTTAQHAGFTGAGAELTVDTDKNTVVVHDGATAGGHPLAKEAALADKADATATADALATLDQNVNVRLRFDTAQSLTNSQKQQAMANAGVPLSEFYESGELTITSGSFITLTHGLSGIPRLATGVLRCKTAEHDYSVGDEILAMTIESADYGSIIVLRPTQVVVLYGTNPSVFTAKHSSTRAGVLLTNANWRLIVRAWR